MASTGFCSPSHEESFKRTKTCFSREALVKLAQAWNDDHPDDRIGLSFTKKRLWDALDERLADSCGGSGREWCWADVLQKAKASPVVSKSIRPQRPREWYKDPYTWLSNYDIEAVMRQYQDDKKNRFKFLGVFPMDFEARSGLFGTCLFPEVCGFNVGAFARKSKRGPKYVGMITNLDFHDEDGSHWTSVFMCLDPKSPNFGIYYYDSVSPKRPPKEMAAFMEKMKGQALEYARQVGVPDATFKVEHNKVRHQYGNTECGVFSMAFQIRWLDMLRTDPATRFEDVVDVKLRDEHVHRLRNVLFRPNIRAVAAPVDSKK